jgi:hypothetical protein
VGEVGNKGTSRGVRSAFSNCPELHKPVLEILSACKVNERKRDGPGFHFSCAIDGDYWFFYF